MKESHSVEQFSVQVMNVVNQIRLNDDELIDQKVVEKILRSLPSKFDTIVVAIEKSKDLSKLSIDELFGSLYNHEYRLNSNSSLENAFKSQMTLGRGKGRGNSRFRRRGRGNFQREERRSPEPGGRRNKSFNTRGHSNNQSSQSYDKSNIQCYYCKKYGHFASEYRKKQVDIGKQYANFSENSSETLFITCHIAEESPSDSWFLDRGCRNHMIGNRDLFDYLDSYIKSEVKLGNNDTVEVMGKGTINVMTNFGKRTIPNVYYAPGLKHNLISHGQLVQKGYKVIFENNVCTIFDKYPSNMIIAKIEMTRTRMYPLRVKSEKVG